MKGPKELLDTDGDAIELAASGDELTVNWPCGDSRMMSLSELLDTLDKLRRAQRALDARVSTPVPEHEDYWLSMQDQDEFSVFEDGDFWNAQATWHYPTARRALMGLRERPAAKKNTRGRRK